MKKRLAIVMAAALTLAMSVPAFAADSDSATAVKEVSSVVNTNGTTTKVVESALGTTVEVTAPTAKTTATVDGVAVPTSATVATGSNAVLSFTDATGKKVEKVSLSVKAASQDTIKTVTSSINVAGSEVKVDAKNIVAAVEIAASGFTSGSASVPLKVDNVVKGEAVYAIHIKNGVAEIIPASVVENGVVVITTSSFSPVIIVKGTAPAAVKTTTTDATQTTSESTATTSPKTADAFPMAMVMAAICLAGAAVCTKKSVVTK